MDSAGQILEQTVRDILGRHPLPMLDAVLLASVRLEVTNDSRQLARLLDMEHALVLRALTGLVDGGWLTVMNRHSRTARVQVELTHDPIADAAAQAA